MGIRDNDGNVAVGTYHLKNSRPGRSTSTSSTSSSTSTSGWTDEKFFHKEFMKFMGDGRSTTRARSRFQPTSTPSGRPSGSG